jgi:2-polyprenyl-3-methyl-5-hydroxy-6-metoxy-1,4-benzoquinol methylase
MAIIDSGIIGEPDVENNNSVSMWDDRYTYVIGDTTSIECSMYKLLSQYIEDGSRVLDIGGGSGNEVQSLLNENPNCKVTIIELSNVACDIGINKYPLIEFICPDFIEWEPNGLYDHIILSQVLEHFDRPDILMDKVMSLVKVGGTVTIGLPHEDVIYYWHQHRYSHDSYHFFKKYSTWVAFSDSNPLTKEIGEKDQRMYVRLVKET